MLRFAFVFFLILAQLFFVFDSVLAAATVTSATGGSAISADTTGGSYTALTGPVISEGATADIGTGTIILNVPSGFIFDTGSSIWALTKNVLNSNVSDDTIKEAIKILANHNHISLSPRYNPARQPFFD